MSKKKIDFLKKRTKRYLLQVNRQELDEEQTMEIASCLAILNNIRHTSGIMTRTMVPLIERKTGLKELSEYQMMAGTQLERLERVLKKGTRKLAKKTKKKSRCSSLDPHFQGTGKPSKKIKKKKSHYSILDLHFRQQHIKHLLEERHEYKETHRIHLAMIDAIKQITLYTTSIAEQILASEVAGTQNQGYIDTINQTSTRVLKHK